jgi:hypothetical protein
MMATFATASHGESIMRHSALFATLSLLALGAVFAANAQQPAGLPRTKAPAGAEVFFVAPTDGATVGQDVKAVFGVKGIAVAPATDTAPGTGHHHLLIDQKDLPPGDAPIPNDATRKHYGKGQTEDTIHLEPGDHTLQLDFADAAHMQFNPPIVSKKITIHVK